MSKAAAKAKPSKVASALIRNQIEQTTSDYDREKLQERLAKFVGGVAVIKVGAATETEMKEKKARVEDAMHATRAAVEEGIVPGGGVALVRASKVLDNFKTESEDADEQDRCHDRQTRSRRTASPDCPERWHGRRGHRRQSSRKRQRENYGFNAATEKFEDLVAAGVIDPAKVTRYALQNAASIAGLMLTTEAMIADVADEKGGDGGMGGMGGGMGGMGMGM